MFGNKSVLITLLALISAYAQASFVTIGGTGVAADTTGYGGVNYSYQISRYEVTGAEFGAAVAADSRIGGCSYDATNGPAYYVSWYESAMYCNWLTSGDAYLGAYSFDTNGTYLGVDRTAAISIYGTVYALPTEDEWYKAAYWTGDVSDQWSLYANGTDATPIWGTTEGWNYRDGTYGYAYGMDTWAVGYGAQEQNGTYDMMGNVWEWTESMYDSSRQVTRGGALSSSSFGTSASTRGKITPSDESYSNVGFRVAVIPEPATALLFFIGGLGSWILRRNRKPFTEVSFDGEQITSPGRAVGTLILLFILLGASANASFVAIGGTGVAADTNGYGAVNYSYRISQYEVTGAEFGAAVAADSRIGGCSSDAPNAPAYYVSWYESAKYCNWLTSGDAYLGAYLFDGSGTFTGIDRASAISTYGIIYALPTEDEWYKAAYWTGDVSDQWSLYANGADTKPTWGTTAGWNYRDGTYGYAYGMDTWPVGYGAQEQNGTYDMMGNVWEWTEAIYKDTRQLVRGGSYGNDSLAMSSASRGGGYPDREYSDTGFRIVMIPEPATALLFFIGGGGAWLLRRNSLKNQEDGE